MKLGAISSIDTQHIHQGANAQQVAEASMKSPNTDIAMPDGASNGNAKPPTLVCKTCCPAMVGQEAHAWPDLGGTRQAHISVPGARSYFRDNANQWAVIPASLYIRVLRCETTACQSNSVPFSMILILQSIQ